MSQRSNSAIALLSGGLDSSVALFLARKEGWEVKLALTFDYGQRSAAREIAHASDLCRLFGITHRALPLPWFKEWTSSALLSEERKMPHPSRLELDEMEYAQKSAKAVWVPNRNGIFIEIAAGFADDLAADAVIVGFNREEAQTFPDNSEAYLSAVSEALRLSTSNSVKVISPTAKWDKQQLVQIASEGGFPFSYLWSCYEGREKMCGRCESCQRLKRALDANGISHDQFEDLRF